MKWRTTAIAALVALAAAGATAAPGLAGSTSAGEPAILLPDLDQRPPTEIGALTDSAGRSRLIFASAVENRGRGRLIVDGRRSSRRQLLMRADQVLQRSDGTSFRRPNVGRMRYVIYPDHRHWHFEGFMRFELHPADGQVAPRRDRKTGFCLGDRFEAEGLAGRPPAYQGRCGLDRPDLLQVTEGIAPGWGDDYAANIEGQYIDITGLPAGRYLLVHRSDPGAEVLETTRRNNASSTLIRLTWRGRAAQVQTLQTCPDTASCGGTAPRRAPSFAQELAQAGVDCAIPAGLRAQE